MATSSLVRTRRLKSSSNKVRKVADLSSGHSLHTYSVAPMARSAKSISTVSPLGVSLLSELNACVQQDDECLDLFR